MGAIIGADGLNCRVRDGIGCDPVAKGTRTKGSKKRKLKTEIRTSSCHVANKRRSVRVSRLTL